MSKLETTHKYVSVHKSTSQIRNRDSTVTTCADDKLDYCLPYIMHNFLMTNKKMKIVRSYKGIVESVSEIGGIIDLIFMIFVLLYSFYHRIAVQSYLVKEIYGLKKEPSTICRNKKRSELISVGIEEDPINKEIYKKAEERLEKDLDLVGLIEEMNAIKIFLFDTFGPKFPEEEENIAVLKLLDSCRNRSKSDNISNQRGTEFVRQFSSSANGNSQPRSTIAGRENSGITKPQTLPLSPDQSSKRQIKYKKTVLSHTGNKPPQEQTSKFAQLKPQADSQLQVSEFEVNK